MSVLPAFRWVCVARGELAAKYQENTGTQNCQQTVGVRNTPQIRSPLPTHHVYPHVPLNTFYFSTRQPAASSTTNISNPLPLSSFCTLQQHMLPLLLRRQQPVAAALTPLTAATTHLAASAAPSSHQQQQQQAASFSSADGIDGRIGADPEEVADLLEANIYKPTKAEREQMRETARTRLLTTRREALSLYREVLRYSNLFVWRDEHGRMWRDVIRSSARQEFEAARHEPDPELINRMIVTGRDAVHRTVEGFLKKRARIIDEESSNPQVPPL
jgi:hypothetical protein